MIKIVRHLSIATIIVAFMANMAAAESNSPKEPAKDSAPSGMAMQPKGDAGPSSMAFHGIMAKMHQDMAIPFTGNADVDFVKQMIPHHESAVEMAKTELSYGKDPDVRKLAEDVIKAQEAEIAWMKTWLKKNGQ